ncbi:hypothetical protein ACIRYZ_25880 [Kitasatospora sp. NPDC101155]|uniref:hypothetical protein n=1 Tax=Kitasatospora sp. NPDC101155 TaxID=3364097 RepID=UPI00380D03CA
MGDLFVLAGEATEQAQPLGAIEQQQDLVSVGLGAKESEEGFELGPDLSVLVGQKAPQAPLDNATWALSVGEKGVEAAAARADPLAGVAGARPADFLSGGVKTDERAAFRALGTGCRAVSDLGVARAADIAERKAGMDPPFLVAQCAELSGSTAPAARPTPRLARRQPVSATPLLSAVATDEHRWNPTAFAQPGARRPVSADTRLAPTAVCALDYTGEVVAT